jgi:PAS domain S-box-containing protein
MDFKTWHASGIKAKLAVVLVGLMYTCGIGVIDLVTSSGLNLDFFFLLGCAAAGWVAGAHAALLLALISVAFLCADSAQGGGPSLPQWIVGWNLLLHWLAFASIGWLASELGRARRGLELIVRERTDLLSNKVEEHKETEQLLREAMQLFRQVTENITSVFWVTDPAKSRVEYVSPEFEKVWGESCRRLYESPSTWLERIHHEDRERVARAIFEKQTIGDYDEEYRVVRSDGAVRWVHDRAFPIKNDMGAVYRLVGIAEDITDQKRTQNLLQTERDIGLALSSTSDLKFALERLLEIAVQLEGIDCGGVYLFNSENGELHLEAHRNLSVSFLKRISHYKADTAEARAARNGANHYMREDQIPRSLEVLWGSEGLRALAVVPVRHQEGVLGMLNLGSYRQDEIPPRTRVGIEMIASQVAGAIARIRAEELLRQKEAHLRTIVNSAPIALMAADVTGTITFEDGQALHAMGMRPGENLHRRVVDIYSDFPLIQDNVGRALAGEEFSSVLEFPSTIFECHYTPVYDKDRQPAGFIAVGTDVTERFRLQREILEISDREQARIGQDVHDGLCQQLIGLALNANSLLQRLRAQAVDGAAAEKICALLDEAITESRRVCRGLYPVRLKTEGLGPALEELASSVSERFSIRCLYESDGSQPRCNVATATHLYRIAQEAVNNALKHSKGRHISIRLCRAGTELELAIQDDGTGIGAPVESGQRDGGMGLHIMDYRARSIGGNLIIRGKGDGTLVRCRVPQHACERMNGNGNSNPNELHALDYKSSGE